MEKAELLCYTSRMTNKLSPTLFARKCTVDPATGCWLWTSSLQTGGYGTVRIQGETWLTHRASWHVHRGPIPPGKHVLHACDVRPCCNPDHLFLGTPKDNHDDMLAKGRGAKRHRAHTRVRKLADSDVERILAARETPAALAASLGVRVQTIYNIRNGRRKKGVASGLPRRAVPVRLDRRRLAPQIPLG